LVVDAGDDVTEYVNEELNELPAGIPGEDRITIEGHHDAFSQNCLGVRTS